MLKVTFKYYLVLLLVSVSITLRGQKDCIAIYKGQNLKYQGECKKGKAHGEGVIDDDIYYRGMLKNGIFHGVGELVMKDGDIYKGQWKRGKKDGKGILIGRSDIVTGYWSQDDYIGKYKSGYKLLNQTMLYEFKVEYLENDSEHKVLVNVMDDFAPIHQTNLYIDDTLFYSSKQRKIDKSNRFSFISRSEVPYASNWKGRVN